MHSETIIFYSWDENFSKYPKAFWSDLSDENFSNFMNNHSLCRALEAYMLSEVNVPHSSIYMQSVLLINRAYDDAAISLFELNGKGRF